MIMVQGNLPMEDFDLKFTHTWESLILWVSKMYFSKTFVLEILRTEEWDRFDLYTVS